MAGMKKLAIALSIAAALSGCSGVDLDRRACQDVADYLNQGAPMASRALVLEKIGTVPDAELQQHLQEMRRDQERHPDAWIADLDAFASRCLALKVERNW